MLEDVRENQVLKMGYVNLEEMQGRESLCQKLKVKGAAGKRQEETRIQRYLRWKEKLKELIKA